MRLTFSFLSFIWSHIGHCSQCTRRALLSAAGAWTALALAKACEWPASVSELAGAAALALTVLWLAHIIAFSIKLRRLISAAPNAPVDEGRRALTPRLTALVALATAAAIAPRLASAKLSMPPSLAWKPIGRAKGATPIRLAQNGCQPVSYGCNSCCNNGISGNYFIRSDCSTGCSMGCGNDKCQ